VTGIAETAISAVAPATVAVPVEHALASKKLPPMADVSPDNGIVAGAKNPA
jgi:hypothetical protein